MRLELYEAMLKLIAAYDAHRAEMTQQRLVDLLIQLKRVVELAKDGMTR